MIRNIILSFTLFNFAFCDDSQSIVNGLKAVHVVDEKFLSISIDPAIFFSGININQAAIDLAKHFTSSYIRIAGPSTAFVEFSEDESKATSHISPKTNSIIFAPAMWWTLNEWIQRLNYTPIYSLNDRDRVNNDWDPKGVLNLLDMTSNMNVDCFWQLGFDSSGKTEHQYKQDLKTLAHILDAFPNKKSTWRTVGSDLSKCFPSEHPEVLRRYLDDLEGVDVVMWEPSRNSEEDIFNDDAMYRLLNTYRPKISVWTSAPKSNHPITAHSGLDWAIQIGEAAVTGFDVIFRQPRLQEIFADTPVYWVSILHKKLMGRNVLDVKTTSLLVSEAYVYAHCAKDQHNYSIAGAMTIMLINNGTEDHKTSLRVGGSQMKNVEVRSYILTWPNDMVTYLNGEKLTMSMLQNDKLELRSKLRRAKAVTHLILELPPKSVGFFVMPGARIPVCLNDEDNTVQILEEIHQTQMAISPVETTTSVHNRFNNVSSLLSVYNGIEAEMKEDERFYRMHQAKATKPDDWRRNLLDKLRGSNSKTAQKLEGGNKSSVKGRPDAKRVMQKEKPKMDLNLSSAEVLKILTDRAKVRVEKQVGLATSDVDDVIQKAFQKKILAKRDINMDLLNKKAGSKVTKVATLRKPDETSDEFLLVEAEPEFSKPVKRITDIIAGLAENNDDDHRAALPGLPLKPITTAETIKPGLSSLLSLNKRLFNFEPQTLSLPHMPSSVSLGTKAVAPQAVKNTQVLKYVKEDEGDDDDLFNEAEDLNDYHGFDSLFGGALKTRAKDAGSRKELMELDGDYDTGEEPTEKRKSKTAALKDFKTDDLDDFDADSIESIFGRIKRDISTLQNRPPKITARKRGSNKEKLFHLHKLKTNKEFHKSIAARNQRPSTRNHIQKERNKFRLRRKERRRKQRKPKRFSLTDRSRKARSTNEVYVPKVDLDAMVVKDYESPFMKMEKWKAEDILMMPKRPRTVVYAEGVESTEEDVPVVRNTIREHKKKNTSRNDTELVNNKNEITSKPNKTSLDSEELNDRMKDFSNSDKKNSAMNNNNENSSSDLFKTESMMMDNSIPDFIKQNSSTKSEGLNTLELKRIPRFIIGSIDSVENAIDSLPNTIEKETIDTESGEYKIIFPTKDMILVKQIQGDSKIKIHTGDIKNINNEIEKEKEDVDMSTCVPTEAEPTKLTSESYDTTEEQSTDVNLLGKDHAMEPDSYIIDKIFNKINQVINTVYDKISNWLV